MNTNNSRIGLIGGTFDPIHLGHLNSAEEIADLFQLRKVIFIPLSLPPHKGRGLALAKHRLNMTMLAVLSNPRFEASDLEIKRGGISYTIDTIKEIKNSFTGSTEFFFITGSDAFNDIGEWKEAHTLFNECHFVVNTRPGFKRNDVRNLLKKKITERLGEPDFILKKSESVNEITKLGVVGSSFGVNIVSTTGIEISSTHIRKRVSLGKSIKYLVPGNVECYIMKEGLYRG